MGRDSSVGIATHYELDGPAVEFRCGRDIPHSPIPSLKPTSLLYIGYRVFPGVKQPRSGVDHPPSNRAEVKERVNLYLNSPSRPSWPVLGWTLPLPGAYRFLEADGIRDMIKGTLWKVTVKISKNEVTKWDLGFLLWLMLGVRSYETKNRVVWSTVRTLRRNVVSPSSRICENAKTEKRYITIRVREKSQASEFICKQQVWKMKPRICHYELRQIIRMRED